MYTSSSKALAALETLVHLSPPVILTYVAFRIEFDNRLIERLPPKALPPDWQAEPPAPSTREIGDVWVREGRSAVLEVPSILIPEEPNYLLNPGHPDYRQIAVGGPTPFAFDPRLLL